jgi:hypothetical protein
MFFVIFTFFFVPVVIFREAMNTSAATIVSRIVSAADSSSVPQCCLLFDVRYLSQVPPPSALLATLRTNSEQAQVPMLTVATQAGSSRALDLGPRECEETVTTNAVPAARVLEVFVRM